MLRIDEEPKGESSRVQGISRVHAEAANRCHSSVHLYPEPERKNQYHLTLDPSVNGLTVCSITMGTSASRTTGILAASVNPEKLKGEVVYRRRALPRVREAGKRLARRDMVMGGPNEKWIGTNDEERDDGRHMYKTRSECRATTSTLR